MSGGKARIIDVVDVHAQPSFFASKPQSDLHDGVHIWHTGINFADERRRQDDEPLVRWFSLQAGLLIK